MTENQHAALVTALNLLMDRRGQCAYRGRGWWLLNNAMAHLGDNFWREIMDRQTAAEFIGHYVDDALSTEPFQGEVDGVIATMDQDAIAEDPLITLVGYQCGFEPMFVAVRSYLGVKLDDDEAEELARDSLVEKQWFADNAEPPDADYIL